MRASYERSSKNPTHTHTSFDGAHEKALDTDESAVEEQAERNPAEFAWLLGARATREPGEDSPVSIMTLIREGKTRYTGPTIAKYVTIGVRGTPAGTLVNIPMVYPMSQEQVDYAQKVAAEMATPEYKARERRCLEQLWAQDAAERKARMQQQKGLMKMALQGIKLIIQRWRSAK